MNNPSNTLEKIWKKGKDFLGVNFPIICGGMTWISNYELVKAVSDNGAFPVLAAGNMPPDLFEREVDKCAAGLPGPFAVNLVTIAPNFQAHKEIIVTKKVPFVVFAGNFPKVGDVRAVKQAGIRAMSFASTESIAKQMIRFGVDALLLEGNEAGGHIGHVSLTILLQQVLFNIRDTPIFVAGGIASGQMAAHMLLMGAYGVQMGTRFVMTEECTAHPKFKDAFIRARAREAVETPQYDSRLPVVSVRAIKNEGMQKFGRLQMDLLKKLESGEVTREEAQYEVENFWMGSLRRAVIDGDVDQGSLMAGQSVGLMKKVLPMKQVIQNMVDEIDSELAAVRSLFASSF